MCYGPEFTGCLFLAWCERRKIAVDYIQPGKPQQNGQIEASMADRDECLNVNSFHDLADVAQKIEGWR